MHVVSLVEQMFFVLEKKKQPMHVGGLFLFELPEGADTDFVTQLVQQMHTNQTPPAYPFNQILDNLTFWKTQTDVDIQHHLHHIDLACSDHNSDLLGYIAKVHARALDKSRPLWEFHIIEGIEPASAGAPDRFGMYVKIHHALVDGIAAMRLVQKSLSTSANETMTLPPWALLKRNDENRAVVAPPERSATELIKEQFQSVKPVFQELKDSFASRNKPSHVSTLQAPASIFNQRISSLRKITTHSYASARFKNIATRLGVSRNDVVLAACSGAIRQYLITMNALPAEPLVAVVPMSLRKDDSATGNQASLVLCNLGTHLADPLERINIINDSMNMSKARFDRMNQTEVLNYTAIAYAWEGVNLLTGAYPKKQAFNLMVSNVPGPDKPLYWNGAKLTALYPASVLFDGQALNITLVNYLDHIDFGIIACDETVPNTQNLPKLIEQELATLEKLALDTQINKR